MNISSHKTKIKRLASGAKLVHISSPRLPYSAIGAFVRAGSRFDPKDKEGVAHFLEHLCMTKTKRFHTAEERFQKLESFGIDCSASTHKEFVSFYHTQTHERTSASLRLLVDGLNYSWFDEQDVKRERAVILDEVSREEGERGKVIWKAGSNLLWPKSLLGRSLIGNKDSIQSISFEDLASFRNTFYSSRNLVFVVVEQKDGFKEATRIIEKEYKPQKHKDIVYRDRFLSPVRTTFQKPLSGLQQDDEHLDIGLYFRISPPKNIRDRVTVSFIRDYLSNTWISKLVEELRFKRGLTYWVSGDSDYFSDTGYLELAFSTTKNNVISALEICFNEIKKIKAGKTDNAKELKNHKTSKASHIIKSCANPHTLFQWYGEDAVLGAKLLSPHDYIKEMNKISVEDMQVAANKYFKKKNLSLVILGQRKKTLEAEVKELIKKLF